MSEDAYRFVMQEVAGQAGWEQRWQVTYIEPATQHPGSDRPAPRLNIVVSRVPSQHDTADAALEEFIEQTAAAVSGLEQVDDPQDFAFADGVVGRSIAVRFPVAATVMLRQVHVFRLDRATRLTTQIVLTLPPERAAEEHVWLARIASFRPA